MDHKLLGHPPFFLLAAINFSAFVVPTVTKYGKEGEEKSIRHSVCFLIKVSIYYLISSVSIMQKKKHRMHKHSSFISMLSNSRIRLFYW